LMLSAHIIWFKILVFLTSNLSVSFITMTANGLGLCEGGEMEAQMLLLVQMLIRIPMLKFSTNAPLLQTHCYVPFFLSSCFENPFIVLPPYFQASSFSFCRSASKLSLGIKFSSALWVI